MFAQTDRQEDEEGASQGVQGICSDDRRGFLTFLDNVWVNWHRVKGELAGVAKSMSKWLATLWRKLRSTKALNWFFIAMFGLHVNPLRISTLHVFSVSRYPFVTRTVVKAFFFFLFLFPYFLFVYP